MKKTQLTIQLKRVLARYYLGARELGKAPENDFLSCYVPDIDLLSRGRFVKYGETPVSNNHPAKFQNN